MPPAIRPSECDDPLKLEERRLHRWRLEADGADGLDGPELVEGRADALAHRDRLEPFVAPQGDLLPLGLAAGGEELDTLLRNLLVGAEHDPVAVGVAVGRLRDDEAA